MNLARKFPVATFLSAVGVLATFEQVAEGEGLLSGQTALWVKLGLAAVGALLGLFAHNASTPIADPKAADGTPLVPAAPTR